jgi:protein-disulfide isomerase
MLHRIKLFICLTLVIGCTTDSQIKKHVRAVLKEDPQLLVDAIKNNPAEFVEAFQIALRDSQGALAEKRKKQEEKKLKESFDTPLVPQIRKDESIRGDKNSPLLLVEYSDFECPFCSRGYKTVVELLKKYKGKIGFVYKHLPLSFHANANIAAKYYEAIRLQSSKKAFKFHDEIFANQRKIKNGEKFLKAIAKKVSVNMAKLKKDLKNPIIQKRIDEDVKEAAKFGIQGTPGFLINGIPVKGAYPSSHFVKIIKQLEDKGKLKL